jgi:sec-independent protein translocase protein TatB
MFNLGAGEIAVILIVALLLLGPDKLPELARGIGKFVREFRRQTDDVRGMVEREFYKMDQEVFAGEQGQAKRIEPPASSESAAPSESAAAPTASPEGELTPPTYPSVFPPPEGVVAAKPSSAAPLGLEPPAPAPAPASTEPATASAAEPGVPARPEGEPASHG